MSVALVSEKPVDNRLQLAYKAGKEDGYHQGYLKGLDDMRRECERQLAVLKAEIQKGFL